MEAKVILALNQEKDVINWPSKETFPIKVFLIFQTFLVIFDLNNYRTFPMKTQIFITKKLEKLVKKLVQVNPGESSGILGNWNATVFYVDRKKCWLVTNKKTKYNVVLVDIKSSDLTRIEDIFKNAFYSQLIYDGIITDFKYLDSIIGNLEFFSTDNDKSTTGFQNQRLNDFDWWKYDFPSLADMPIKELAHRTNTIPIHLGKSRKMSDFTYSRDAMKKLLLD